MLLVRDGIPPVPGVLRLRDAALRQPDRARMREDPRLVRGSVGVRADHVRAPAGRRRPRHARVHARLLPPRRGPVHRGDGDEAVARHPQEPQAPGAEAAVPARQRQALLPARSRAPRPAISAETRLIDDHAIGEIYLSAAEIATRVAELGAEIAADYEQLEPLLVAPLKSSAVFLADLSRALPIHHGIDVIELAGYETGASGGVRLLKDLETGRSRDATSSSSRTSSTRA